jgi:carbamoyltransferase
MRILGVSAFYHDSAAALLVDGRIVAAAQEERFTRKKQDASFPAHAIGYCLLEGGIKLSEIDYVVFYEKPFLKFERLLETYVGLAPRGYRSFATAIPVWIREKLFQKAVILREIKQIDPDFGGEDRLLFSEHHLSHAASAFYASPFDEAVVLTMDGVGEWCTTSSAVGSGNKLQVLKELHFPHSLGLLYSAFTYYTGFKVNSGEYKVMGLAPYGRPQYASVILDHLIDLKDDGTFRLDLSYFDYCTGLRMTNDRFNKLFGQPARDPTKDLLTQFHMDMAASIQAVTEEVVLKLTRALAREHGLDNLCLAGGVALNCVANGRALRDGAFKKIWIQPAAGDAGGAVGAALVAWHQFLGKERHADGKHDLMEGALLGPHYAQTDVERRLAQEGARFHVASDEDVIEQTATSLAAGEAVGWMQGRMEFGPRALGARSILGDPRSPSMQKQLNLRIKYRESFRPFAPAVLREHLTDWFELNADSPYMLLVADVKDNRRRRMAGEEQPLFGIDKLTVVRSEIPAVTHVDYSARIQTVHADINPRFHALIERFRCKTGCPILINTSFNVRSEPIVCTPEDAFRCFMGNDIEMLVVGNCMLRKREQNPALKINYQDEFEPD